MSDNDTFGHPAGDHVLQTIAKLLQATARTTDIVARYGGEEFVVLLMETDEKGALDVGERMRSAVARHPWTHRPITVSIGTASLTAAMEAQAMLVEQADQALYRSKAAGRDRVTRYEIEYPKAA